MSTKLTSRVSSAPARSPRRTSRRWPRPRAPSSSAWPTCGPRPRARSPKELGVPSFDSHEALGEALRARRRHRLHAAASHPEICDSLPRARRLGALREAARDRRRQARGACWRRRRARAPGCTMASKFRYVEDVVRAKSIIASGRARRDRPVRERLHLARRHARPLERGPARQRRRRADRQRHPLGRPHAYFLGPLAEVQAVEGQRSQGLAVEDTVTMLRAQRERGDGHDRPVVERSTRSSTLLQHLRLAGHGVRRLEGVEVPPARQRRLDRRSASGYDKVQALSAQLDNFCGVDPRARSSSSIDAEDALASVEVIEAAYAALAESRWQPVPADLPHGPGAMSGGAGS